MCKVPGMVSGMTGRLSSQPPGVFQFDFSSVVTGRDGVDTVGAPRFSDP